MAEFDPDAYLNKEDKKKRSGFDPDAYLKKTQPESALQTFGRSSASLADSALNAVTGTLDYGAYALARAAGRSPEQATAETTSPKDVVGRAFGVTGTPGYEQAPLRQLGTAVGQGLQGSVIEPVAQTTGLPEADVGNMLNSLMMGAGPAVPKVAGAVASAIPKIPGAAKAVYNAPVDIVKGAAGRATGYIAKPGETPTGYQVPSSRIPLGDTFIPAAEMARLEAGLPMSPGAVRPISELAPAPVLALSGGEIPAAGQAMRAFGERIGETYSNPYTAAADVGSMFLTGGIPVLTGMRGALGMAQGAADAYLARKGFKSLSPEQQTILNQGGNPFVATGAVKPSDIPQPIREAAAQRITPVQPQLGYSPAPTPQTIPMGGPGRRVNIEGESFNLPYEIDTSRVQTARPQQAAPQPTIGPVVPETLAPAPVVTPAAESVLGQKLTPEQILAQIQARSGKGAGVFETAGQAPAPQIDLTANRASFLVKINQHRAGLEETRAQNRETFSGTAENLGRGTEAERLARMTPAERSDYLFRQGLKSEGMTDAAVVKDMVSTTTNTGVRRNKNTNIVDNTVFDEFAADAGVMLDWTTAPDISKMGFKEGKNAINDWMYKQIKTPANDLGLDTRGGGIRGQVKAMEEANKNIQPINPAEEAAALNAAQERMKKLRGGGSMEMIGTPPATTFASKQDFLQQQMVDKLAGKSTFGSYIDDGKLYEYIQNPQAKGVPADLAAKLGPQVRVVVTDLTKGTVSKDFKTSGDLIRERINGPVAPDDILEMRTKTPDTFQFGFDESLPVTKRKSDWQKDQMLNQISGDKSPSAYRDGSNIVVDSPNPAYKLSIDGLDVANDFAKNERNKMAYDVNSGKRAPSRGAKFDPRVDNPFTIDDVANDKIPKDKPYKHKFFDGHPDAFDANIYDVEINPRGINTSKVVGNDRITEVYTAEGYQVFTGEDTLTKAGGLTRTVSEYGAMPHKAERGVTPDNRKIFQTESQHPITGQTMVQRYVGGVDIAKTNPEWFRHDLSDMIPEKDITYVYKPENPAMKTQTFTAEQFKNLPVDTYGDMLPIKDIKKITNKQISEIFTTKKKGK